ncbi:Tn3 family transposase, partial [Pseudomonas aeruginosa]|uniref:Tn3 family transposase n=1 Tax=Pseudomonas aeruginosa TaxID=287 RepID=UPI0035253849
RGQVQAATAAATGLACFIFRFLRRPQEDQLGALGLVVNIIVLWNTLYMTAAVERLKQHGYPVLEEDLARLSPLIYEHINMLGRYSFAVPEEVARGELRPLRNPDDDL